MQLLGLQSRAMSLERKSRGVFSSILQLDITLARHKGGGVQLTVEKNASIIAIYEQFLGAIPEVAGVEG